MTSSTPQRDLGSPPDLRKGLVDRALARLQGAIQDKPDSAVLHFRLANVRRDQGDIAGAAAGYRRVLRLEPKHLPACHALALLLEKQGAIREAADLQRKVVAAQPTSAAAWANLAGVLSQTGDLAEAAEACQRALALDPDSAQAHVNLAAIHLRRQEPALAADSCRRALARDRGCMAALSNLGTALFEQGEWEASLKCYERMLELEPKSATGAYYAGLTHLALGDFHRGWKRYEARWHCQAVQPFRREFSHPQWRGEPLSGQRILLHAEQGLGDTIQFARYVPLVAERGGQVLFEVPSALRRLFGGLRGEAQLVSRSEPLPPFDCHCPLLSLPLTFKTELSTIPAQVPYLHVNSEESQKWSRRLRERRLRVGLVWAGNPQHPQDCQRSLALEQMAPLLAVGGVGFYALQKRSARMEPLPLPPGVSLTDLGMQQQDMAETAAIIANLDLLISVDTSVAHLAGAMGKPVWILLAYACDWRWLRRRNDSPWYPTARLFRQTVRNDWSQPMADAASALSGLAAEHSQRHNLLHFAS